MTGPKPPNDAVPPPTAPVRIDFLLLGWLFPGLGHIAAGERTRGGLIAAAAALLISGGLLIGGLDVVDRKNDRLWFIAQAGNGPIAFVLDAARSRMSPGQEYEFRRDREMRQRYEDGDPVIISGLHRASIGHLNEIGTLWIALCGLMNVVVLIDFLNPSRISARGDSEGDMATGASA